MNQRYFKLFVRNINLVHKDIKLLNMIAKYSLLLHITQKSVLQNTLP